MSAQTYVSPEVLVIRPPSGLAPLDLKQLWQFRDLLAAFAERDIRLRYRQTVLGAIWVILQPLLGAGIFSIVFGVIAKLPANGAPYFLITYSGFLGWTLFQGVVTRVTPSLVANGPLIRKVFFPRLLAPLGVVPSVLVDFTVCLAMMAVLMAVHQIAPGWGVLLAPASLTILVVMSFGAALVATSLAVKYRDVAHVTPFAVQLAMYASPVGYSVLAVPPEHRNLYFLLNPIAAPIEATRWALLGVGEPQLGWLAYSAAVAVIVLVIGLLVFHSFEREFADVI